MTSPKANKLPKLPKFSLKRYQYLKHKLIKEIIILFICGVIVSIILLAVYFRRGRNALWGGLTAGVIIGFIIALFSGFNWYIVGKGAISGTMVGFVTELLGTLSDYLKKRT